MDVAAAIIGGGRAHGAELLYLVRLWASAADEGVVGARVRDGGLRVGALRVRACSAAGHGGGRLAPGGHVGCGAPPAISGFLLALGSVVGRAGAADHADGGEGGVVVGVVAVLLDFLSAQLLGVLALLATSPEPEGEKGYCHDGDYNCDGGSAGPGEPFAAAAAAGVSIVERRVGG